VRRGRSRRAEPAHQDGLWRCGVSPRIRMARKAEGERGAGDCAGLKEMKRYRWIYRTPDGFEDLEMRGDGKSLTCLLFMDSRDFGRLACEAELRDTPVFRETRRWLDAYFGGEAPDFTPPLSIEGVTPFRQDVIEAMLRIPFGATASYGDLARAISQKHGGKVVSARAVGGAVGWNPICVIVPCHRVIGADGSLTGYGGGIANKIALLSHEGSMPCH